MSEVRPELKLPMADWKTMDIRKRANELMKLSYRAERISMVLHWPLYWVARALHSIATLLEKRASKKRDARRQKLAERSKTDALAAKASKSK